MERILVKGVPGCKTFETAEIVTTADVPEIHQIELEMFKKCQLNFVLTAV